MRWLLINLMWFRHSLVNKTIWIILDVMYTVAGPSGRLLTSLAVALYCFGNHWTNQNYLINWFEPLGLIDGFPGTCITFLIIIGDQFDRAFASLVGPQFCYTWYLNRSVQWLGISVLDKYSFNPVAPENLGPDPRVFSTLPGIKYANPSKEVHWKIYFSIGLCLFKTPLV